MITISLCMIVKNEEETIERCLGSVRGIADEIIIVDTGSTDKTKEKASKFTDKIYDFQWVNDFSRARNYAFSKAAMEYILWLDADDIILPEDRAKFMELKFSLPEDVDAVMMKYNTSFDSNGKVTFSYYRERLSKRIRGFQWREPVHEYLEVYGKRINSDICITHAKPAERQGSRNLHIYENILAQGNELSSRGNYYYARELKDNGKYKEAAEQFEKFLNLGRGWVEDNINACGELAKCLILTGHDERALPAMLRSFTYDTPRAELCCQIGYWFKNKGKFRHALFWFETATELKKPEDSWGFINHDYWDYIPYLECTICCDKLGDYQKAEEYNEKAAMCKPDSQAVQYNRNYFQRRRDAEKV